MRLFQFLKREKRGATKNPTMGARVEMWGNDLWSISIMGKKNRTTSESKSSNKLAMFILFFSVCSFVRNTTYDLNKNQR